MMIQSTSKISVFVMILAAVAMMTFPCAGEIVEIELIQHGDMECGGDATTLPTGWGAIGTMTGGVSADTPDASGQSLLNHNDSGGSDWGPYVRYVANIPPGMTEYKLSYWHKGGTWYSTLVADSSTCLADLAGSATWVHYELPWRDNAPGASVFRLYLYAHWNGVPVLFDNVSLLVKVPAQLVGIEVLSNGDIELGGSPTTPPTDWDSLDGVVGVTNDTRDCSSQSLLVFNDGGAAYEGLARQEQSIAPGATQWKLSFSYKGDNPRVQVSDEAHTQLYANHPADLFPGGSGQRQHNVWTDFTTGWLPTNTEDSEMMRLRMYDIANNAEPVWFDNVSLQVYYPPPKGTVVLVK